MKRKILAGVITLTMIFTLLTGCGKDNTDASDNNMIYGEVTAIDDDSVTIKLGTLNIEHRELPDKENATNETMKNEPDNMAAGNGENESGNEEKNDGEMESKSIISYTGDSKTYKFAENVIARSQKMMGGHDRNGHYSENETDENGEAVTRPEGGMGEIPTDENGETVTRPEGGMGEIPTDENGEMVARPEGENGREEIGQMAKKIEISDVQVGDIVAITLDEDGNVKDILVYSFNKIDAKKEEQSEESL